MTKSYHEQKGYKSRGHGIFNPVTKKTEAPAPKNIPLCNAPFCCEDGRFGVKFKYYFCRHHLERADDYIKAIEADEA